MNETSGEKRGGLCMNKLTNETIEQDYLWQNYMHTKQQ